MQLWDVSVTRGQCHCKSKPVVTNNRRRVLKPACCEVKESQKEYAKEGGELTVVVISCQTDAEANSETGSDKNAADDASYG